ncbi:pancreatic lipase-related protein 2 [Alligator mississippiensis]|uniref:pancreatic lipase-related protein 2 n=1 Tax=Alligator mississippiensis TaxID=8496 RepID=UPI002877CE8A|nr:pancreatic lipase-related protein 2 [Alligator mississippiensis]
MFGIWIAALFLLDTAKGSDVCYQRLGCFPNKPPWTGTLQRPLTGSPSSPERVKTTFLLYTRANPNRCQEISAIKPSTIKASNFRTNRTTRFLIHGYSTRNDIIWQIDMCKLMFQVEDVNCIVVDWRGGSDVIYTDAVSNIRIVGAELKYLMDLLERDYGYTPANIHIIGHSLGAHAAGEAGRRKRGIARITGLDPAGPYFHSTPPEVRLDPSDAEFVDVIHSNAGRLFFDFAVGINQPSGHLDFYPNGGKTMPGCPLLREQPVSRDVNEVMRGWPKSTVTILGQSQHHTRRPPRGPVTEMKHHVNVRFSCTRELLNKEIQTQRRFSQFTSNFLVVDNLSK